MAKKNQAHAEKPLNNVGEVVGRSEQFIEKNKKALSISVIAIVVIIAGYVLANTYYFSPRQQRASEALFAGEQYFAKGDFEKALNGDDYEYAGFEAVAKDYKGTKAANLAKAYMGLSLAQLNRYEEAVPYLKAFKGKDAMIAPSVLAALGNCYAQLGNNADAASTLVKAAKEADNSVLSPEYLIQAAQLYEAMDKKSEALKLYKQVKEEYYTSNSAREIEKYIERVSE